MFTIRAMLMFNIVLALWLYLCFGHMPRVRDSLRASVRVSAEVRNRTTVRALLGLGQMLRALLNLGLGLRYADIYPLIYGQVLC